MPLVTFTRVASAELIDAQDWYENEAAGLGKRFRAALEALIERMRANPHQFPLVYKNIRRGLLQHFPYALLFVIERTTR